MPRKRASPKPLSKDEIIKNLQATNETLLKTLLIYTTRRNRKPWKIVIDNDIKGYYGTCSHRTRTIRINARAHVGRPQKLIDTLLHEDLHRRFPYKSEDEITKLTKARRITQGQRKRLLAMFAEAKAEHLKKHHSFTARRRKASPRRGKALNTMRRFLGALLTAGGWRALFRSNE
jgi:hypothetical protein